MKRLYCVDFSYEPGSTAAMQPYLRLPPARMAHRSLVRLFHCAAIWNLLLKKYLRLISIFIFSFITFSSFAQKNLNDTSSVEVRVFSDSSIKAFKNDPHFQYTKMIEPPESLWDRFWAWVWEKIEDILSSKAGAISVWVVLIAFALAAIIYFILKTSGMKSNGFFARKSAAGKDFQIGEENIHAISFDIEINKAISSGNFRLAVRLLYLQTLKILSDKSFIHWDQNKTNFAYIKELEGKSQQPMFANLTDTFEYTWYGNNNISEEKFKDIQNQFQQFKQF